MPILFYRLDSLSISNNVISSITKAGNMAFRWIKLYGFRKFDSNRLLLKNCKTMSAKFCSIEVYYFFYNNVSTNCYVSLVHNLWCWFNSSELCQSFLLIYGLSDVNSRCVIHHAVAVAFGACLLE